ncbi:MAG TPA: glycine zipper domain-containing protein [Candidatus Acidoferrum sp.]|nr:glycine zipper domain-containing protein [Candidatus Acidoferrum sp.]
MNYMGLVRSEYIAALALVVITFIILYLTLLFIRREKEHTETLYTGLGMIFGAVVGIPIGDICGLELSLGMVLGALIGAIIGRLFDRHVNKSSV